MAGGALRAVKDHAWALGRANDEEAFHAWMEDKWGLPYQLKLETIFYDARNNTRVLARYTAAEVAMNAIDMQGVPKKSNGVFEVPRWEQLKSLVEATNVALPASTDITAGPALFAPRAVGQGKGARLQEQHTYRKILDKVAALMEFVNAIYTGGIANVAQASHPTVLEMRALEKHEFLKCMRGYYAGICHLQMYNNLMGKVKLITLNT